MSKINNEIISALRVEADDLKTKVSGVRRIERADKASSWPAGESMENQLFHEIWKDPRGQYSIRLAKPGKEFFETAIRYKDGHRANNPNDMRPTVFIDDVPQMVFATFQEVFHELQLTWRKSEFAAELLACILFRSAFMLDHTNSEAGDVGFWRYNPDQRVLDLLNAEIGTMHGMPTTVFLHYLDAIGLNEDVKYHTLGYPIQQGYGRRNNLLTYVNILAMFLERVTFGEVAGSFSRPPAGVAPISQSKAFDIFPWLVGGGITEATPSPYTANLILVPLLGSIGCGELLHAEGNIEEMIPVDKELIRPGSDYFILRASGDSMDKTGINDGDLVLCRQESVAEPGTRVVALINDDATIKEFHHENGAYVLKPQSNNPQHEPIYVKDEMRIQGIVQNVLPNENNSK